MQPEQQDESKLTICKSQEDILSSDLAERKKRGPCLHYNT